MATTIPLEERQELARAAFSRALKDRMGLKIPMRCVNVSFVNARYNPPFFKCCGERRNGSKTVAAKGEVYFHGDGTIAVHIDETREGEVIRRCFVSSHPWVRMEQDSL